MPNPDQISLDRIKTAHPIIREELREGFLECHELLTGRAILRLAYVIRSFAEQDELYSKGRTRPGKIVTNAKGGKSVHNYGLAFDIVLLKDTNDDGTFDSGSWETNVDFDGDGIADWKEVVLVFKRYGFEWGGDWNHFPDKPHFQKTFGLSVMEMKRRYEMKQFISGTNYIKL